MAKVDSGEAARDDSDLPPDSILVPITQETLWQDLNSAYDSEDSTKGSTNPKSYSNPFPWSKTSSASNRVAATNLNATTSAPIIGLPAKIQRTGFISCHRPPSIFPRGRSSGSGSKKSALAADSEPGSPKVSCLGHVLSQRERERRRIQRHGEKEKENKDRAVTCCAGFSSILHCGGRDKKKRSELRRSLSENSRPAEAAEVKKASEGRRQKKGESKKLSKEEGSEVDDAPPPAIAAMKKFSSGRRAASWGDEAAAVAV